MDKKKLARELVEASAVLLKNDGGLLPFPAGKPVAVFGAAQGMPVLSGSGSGAAHTDATDVLGAMRAAGVQRVEPLAAFYAERIAEAKRSLPPDFDYSNFSNMVTSGLMYEIFGQYRENPAEIVPPDELLRIAADETDTALWILGRSSGGEECDRRLEDDFFLSDEENALLDTLCAHFERVAVVLNINGLIDLEWTTRPQIKSVLFLGVPGEGGADALANLLAGRVAPSGKLAVSIARRCEDYPAWRDFSFDKRDPASILTYESYGLTPPEQARAFVRRPVTAYREDIYLGYRYFDSFDVQPLYPFGFGLSYTDFALKNAAVEKADCSLRVSVAVENVGVSAGAEVVQLYVSALGTALSQPKKALKAFAKTPMLQPGESCSLELKIPWRELASYDEARAAWVIERGSYRLLLGTSSASVECICRVEVESDVIVQQVQNRLVMDETFRETLGLFSAPQREPEPVDAPALTLSAEDIPPREQAALAPIDCSAFSDDELAALCIGFGPGIPFSAFLSVPLPNTIENEAGEPLTENDHPTGVNGYVSPAIPAKEVHSVFYKDGPAGIGRTAWPSEMLLACSFDVALLARFGEAVAEECVAEQVDIWLAPALNLHRHPLCGRNFEYFSEDPLLTGVCAIAVLEGLNKHGVLGCAKHFAANEQETYRRGSGKETGGIPAFDAADTLVSERALRELYLKPFQMAVEDGGLRCIMTSFNKINGVFAGGSRELCTDILRGEWGFGGYVVTDWGDMDIVVDGADAVAAGNDVIMPGGPPVIEQIRQGLRDGRIGRADLEAAVGHLLAVVRDLR